MQRPYLYKCDKCGELVEGEENIWKAMGKFFCGKCFNMPMTKKQFNDSHVEFNEPEHYHTHEIDTIEFLKRGFPPEVLTGFLIGNIIKYTQRFQYKNGEEDLMKVVDYSKRLYEWYKETHSK